MPVVRKWICDGCGTSVETPIEDTTCSFFQIRVMAGAWGKDVILCSPCHETLLQKIDPEKWPRVSDGPMHPSDYIPPRRTIHPGPYDPPARG